MKRVLAIDRREFPQRFPWIRRAGRLNCLDWRLPSAVWSAPGSHTELGLFLASWRAVECKEAMQGLEITAAVDLSTKGGNVAGVAAEEYLRVEVLDDDQEAPRLMASLSQVLAFVATRLHAGKRVVVHCDKGQSRSGSVVVAWLMTANNSTYEEALEEVRRHRSCVKPNGGFAAALQALDQNDLAAWREQCGF